MKKPKNHPKTYYAVGIVETDRQVTINGFVFGKLDFDWVDGMRGVIPVFSNKRKAEQYARKLGATVHTFDAVREN